MKKVVTLGEIMLRLSTQVGERLSQTNHLIMHYGGGEANVGVSLSHFGFDVYFVSKVPNSPLGLGVKRHLHSHGVHTDYLVTGGERLGTYYLETGIGERNAKVTYDRKYSSFSNLLVEELDFDEIFKDAVLFHLSGITPALSAGLQEVALIALQKANEYGVMTSFDCNYRASLWNHQEAAAVLQTLLPYVDICFCGELDAIYLLGIEQAADTLTREAKLVFYYEKIKELYPNIQYLSSTFRDVHSASSNVLQGTLFVDGNLYVSKKHTIHPIVDRVGGGDAFAAGILYGLLETLSPQTSVSFATAASALKHTVHGDCNTFTIEEILQFAENGSGKISR
ncbi:sugar kinase [Neobacillus sp. C211]|uniref:Sugar kinase n=1 Tax=Priestia megaterium TaxID=1404 RepID=A0A6H1P0V9_PRIMG|nr:sugar kinase [Priestia megaterium]QIZ07193.1 sugar kinase [Priestia megaterium]